MAITASMRVDPTFSICTARFFHYIPNLSRHSDRDRYDFLTNQFNLEIHKSAYRSVGVPDPNWVETIPQMKKTNTESVWAKFRNGYALYLYVMTEEQHNEGLAQTLERLGFEQTYTAEKSHENSREKQHGALEVWCGQPWVVEERRVQWVKELKISLGLTDEALKKRLEKPPLAITDLAALPTHSQMPERLNYWGANRRIVRDYVIEKTGGYDVTTDSILNTYGIDGTIPLEIIIQRANLWREGRI